MKTMILISLFCMMPYSVHAYPQSSEVTHQVLVFQQRLNRCLDIDKEPRSTSNLAEYGEHVENCYQNIGHEIIQTFYSKFPNMNEDFDELVRAINVAYFHMYASDSCYPMCGTFVSIGPYAHTTVAIRRYLDALLSAVQTRNVLAMAAKPASV